MVAAVAHELLEQLPTPTILVSDDGWVRWANGAFRELVLWDVETRPELHLEVVFGSLTPTLLVQFATVVAGQSEHLTRSCSLTRLDGSTSTAHLHAIHALDAAGDPIGLMVTIALGADLHDTPVDRYRTALDDQSAYVCEWLLDGTLTFCNKAYREFFGYDESVTGRNLDELIDWEEGNSRDAEVAHLRRSGFHTSVRTYEHGRTVEWTNTRVTSPTGEMLSVFSIGRDVTEREDMQDALRKSERRFRTMITHIWDSVVLIDASGQVIQSSAQYRTDLGYPIGYFEGNRLLEAIAPESREMVMVEFAALVEAGLGASAFLEVQAVRADGSRSWLQLDAINLLEDPSVEAVVLTVRNVDRNKRIEAELAERHREAQALVDQRAAFVAQVSHELRNPLHGMLALSELLANGNLPQRYSDAAQAIYRQSVTMRRIVDDLLDAHQLELGTLRVVHETVDIAAVIDDVVTLHSAHTRPSVVLVSSPVEPRVAQVVGDADRLRQALSNLVSNALKHTREGSVEVRVIAGRRGFSRVEVADTGSGIDPADIDRLFQPYQRGKGAEGVRTPGLGLGLAIVSGIVHALGGEVGADRRTTGGSVFWMELPLAADDSGPIELDHGGDDVPVPPGLRVLVADDDPVNLLVAVHQLAQFEAEVTQAEDGEQAWASAQGGTFDVMFIDVQMPGIDGLEVVRRVRALNAGSEQRPVVAVMTASATAADHLAAREAGADEFVAKPATLADIAVVLRRAGERH